MVSQRLLTPFAVFIGDQTVPGYAKTGFGLLEWRREDCLYQVRLTPDAVDLGLPDKSIDELQGQVKALVIGSAPRGGILPDHWTDSLSRAARSGINIVSGLHARLRSIPDLVAAANLGGANLWDVRVPPPDLPVATGEKRSGKRVLTVGTDCVAGKKYTALAVSKELQRRNIPSDFRATGQTGIIIAGSGIPIDAVVCDFTAGAAEVLSPANDPEHWDVIEGQGSLFHPSYAGVSLGLLHGSQPDAIILCHPGGRDRILGLESFPLPSIEDAIHRNLEAGRLTNPDIRCVGISVNTSGMSAPAKEDLMQAIRQSTGLPCVDPLADGPGLLVDSLLGG